MITLNDEEKYFMQQKLKSSLVKNDIKTAVQIASANNTPNKDIGNIVPFMLENGIDVFEGTDVVLPNMFALSEIEEITIPEGITQIKQRAFQGCTHLTSVKLPSTLNKIDKEAFYECVELKTLFIPESVTSIGKGCFSLCSDDIELTTPKRTEGKLKLRIPNDEVDWYKAHLKTITEEND